MSASPCPTPAQIEDLIAGRLPAERHRVLEEHALGCADCQVAIEALDEPHDGFLATLHAALDPTVLVTVDPFRRALARMKSLPDRSAERAGDLVESHAAHPVVDGLVDFRIIAERGRGGMGIVYEAEQLSLGRRVALKVLPFAELVNGRQLQRFQNEARAAARLEHPHIVPVYGVGSENGVHFIAMQFIEGLDLAQVIRRWREPAREDCAVGAGGSSKFDQAHGERSALQVLLERAALEDADRLNAVVRIGAHAAAALDYARERGIVHRDVKPSNLMLDQSGKLWVTDFGLARTDAGQSLSRTGAVVGTLRYMSPEQLRDQGPIDHRSDVYSLGATLYELLTLIPVFADASHESLHRAILADEPRSPRQLNPRIAPDLETILVKALAKERGERYATAGELAADLGRFLEGKPIRARAIGRFRRGFKWARRRPAVAGLIAVSCLGLALVLAGGWWHAASLQVALTASDKLRIAANEQRQAAMEQEGLARKHERRVRQFLYAADIKLAFAAWENNHVAEVLDLLARHEPKDDQDDLRSFAWHYLWRLCHSELAALSGHTDDVHCVAFSPDGERLATASHDGTAKIWDLADGKELITLLKGHTDQLNAVAFSPDGTMLATGSDDGKVRLWDSRSGEERAALAAHSDDVNTVAFSPHGTLLASGGADRTIKLWDPVTGTELATLVGHMGGVESLAFSPDGRTLASASGDRSAILWDVESRRPRTTLEGHGAVLRSVAFAPSRQIAATGSEDRTAKLWDSSTGQLIATFGGHDETVRCIAFSPDRRTLAAALQDGTVWLWDVEQEKVLRTIRGHAGRLWHLAYSRDGKRLVTASGDRTARIWDARSDERERAALDLPAPVTALAFSPHGTQLVATAASKQAPHFGSCFLVFDIVTGAERRDVYRPSRGIGQTAFSPDGASVVIVGEGRHEKLLYAFPDKWELHRCCLHLAPEVGRLDVVATALSPDYRTLATGEDSDHVTLWDLTTGKELRRLATPRSVYTGSAAFSPDGKKLATGRNDGLGHIWEVATGRMLVALRGHLEEIHQIAFSPDGQTLATASADRMLKLWDTATGAEIAAFQGHKGRVRAAMFSPDGKTLVSGGDDGVVRVWDVATRQELILLNGHRGSVRSLAFSPDGKILASGGAAPGGQGEIHLWPPLVKSR